MSEKRRPYEFSQRTKDKAIINWHADNPGREDEQLQVNHKVAVWFARKFSLPPAVISSDQNAEAMPLEDHKEYHRNESEEEYWSLYQGLVGFVDRLL